MYALGAGTAGARVPFVDPAGGALAVYLVALGAVGWIAANRRLREGVAALGLLVTAWASAVEFEGVALVGAWSALMVVGFALERGLAALAPEASGKASPTISTRWILDHSLPLSAGLIGIVAALHVLAFELPINRFGDVLPPAVPFTDDGAAAAMFLIAGVLTKRVGCGRRAGQTRVIPCRRRRRRVRHPVRGLRLGGRRPVGWPWRTCARDVPDRP